MAPSEEEVVEEVVEEAPVLILGRERTRPLVGVQVEPVKVRQRRVDRLEGVVVLVEPEMAVLVELSPRQEQVEPQILARTEGPAA